MLRAGPPLDELFYGICLSAEDGAILYLNPAARRMLEVPARPAEPLNSCRLLCGKLFAEGSDDPCSVRCGLRDPDSPARAVMFRGRHGPRASSPIVWSGEWLTRLDRWGRYRVRCLRIAGPLWGMTAEARRLTLIEEVSADSAPKRRT